MIIKAAVIVLIATASYANNKDAPCVDYFVIGDLGCHPEQISETEVVAEPAVPLPPPVIEAQQEQTENIGAFQEEKPPTLDDKIDDFLENHGKPPREFVAFHLEPTIENALKWAHAYNQMIQRNQQLTLAWVQAEEIYKQATEQGVDVAKVLATPNALPPAEQFGFAPPASSVPAGEMLQAAQTRPQNLGQFANVSALTGTAPTVPSFNPQNTPNMSANTRAVPASTPMTSSLSGNSIGGQDTIQIRYYFSAECAFCQKFEPEFQRLIASNPSKFDVTCVDLTPTSQTAANINGKVDCKWRPAAAGEARQMGIKSTPTLIVKRSANQPLERISGYVPYNKLAAHLLK